MDLCPLRVTWHPLLRFSMQSQSFPHFYFATCSKAKPAFPAAAVIWRLSFSPPRMRRWWWFARKRGKTELPGNLHGEVASQERSAAGWPLTSDQLILKSRHCRTFVSFSASLHSSLEAPPRCVAIPAQDHRQQVGALRARNFHLVTTRTIFTRCRFADYPL